MGLTNEHVGPKILAKIKTMSSPEQNYFLPFAMRYPVLHFQEFINWKWYVGGMLTLLVALFGLVANSMSMVVLFRPKIRAVAFNQLLFVLCGVDSFFLFCNSMSIGHALGLNNSKCDSKTFTENWDSKRHLLELSLPI